MRWRVAALALALLFLQSPWSSAGATSGAQETGAAEARTTTPIKHFVTLMQQGHSFDNYFGSRAGVDGIPPQTCMPVNPGTEGTECVAPFHIGSRGIVDFGASKDLFDAQVGEGRMDGFVAALDERTRDADLTMGHYDDRDLPFYWNVADEYVLFDRFFSSSFSGSLRNHFYWVAGVPGVGEDDQPPSEGLEGVPTIFDRLEEAGVSWKFYVENYDPATLAAGEPAAQGAIPTASVPLLQYRRFLDDRRLSSKIVPVEELFTDIENGTLPSVSYVVPSTSSERPPARVELGERFVRQIVTALMRSSAWPTSAFAWTYDGWGGWYDHVWPPEVDAFGYGFRVPALLVSPYARRGHVNSTQLDSTSFLRFIEENWGVPPLGSRDSAAVSIASAFDFEAAARPPRFLDRSRQQTPLTTERRSVVFVAYGAVFVVMAAVGSRTWLRGRRLRRSPSVLP